MSFLVHLYSTSYKKETAGNARYYALLGGFTSAMMGIFTTDNLLMLLACWEWVGISSYFLIGFYFKNKTNNRAALHAFLVNKLGSVGMWAGLLTLSLMGGSFSLTSLKILLHEGTAPGEEVPTWLIFCQVCLLLGAFTKAAQSPFSAWLPKAMKGPTPISALIHSATMVAAGVFLLARLDFVLLEKTKNLLIIVGAFTAITAAFSCIFQRKLKKLLAYSTLSHLGFMMTALGVGSLSCALFYLVAHAVAKGCLFLFAGLVEQHGARKTAIGNRPPPPLTDLRMFPRYSRDIKKEWPLSSCAYWLSVLSLLGFPFTAGFSSKEPIVEALVMMTPNAPGGVLVNCLLLVYFSATGIYLGRMSHYVFSGTETTAKVNYAPLAKQAPLWTLGLLSVLLFFIFPMLTVDSYPATLSPPAWAFAIFPSVVFFFSLFFMRLVRKKVLSHQKKASFARAIAWKNRFANALYHARTHRERLLSTSFHGLRRCVRYTERALEKRFSEAAHCLVAVALLCGYADAASTKTTSTGVSMCGRWLSMAVQYPHKQSLQRYAAWSLLFLLLSLYFIYWCATQTTP